MHRPLVRQPLSRPAPGVSDWEHSIKRTAFTLIEALAVIAVVGALLAIFLPSLASTRQSARAAVCAANLHTLATAVALYRDSNRDLIPVAESPWNDTTRFATAVLAQPFEALRPELGEPKNWDTFAPAHCPCDSLVGPVVGFSYWYLPSVSFAFLTTLTPEARLERITAVQREFRSTQNRVLWQDLNPVAHAGRQGTMWQWQYASSDGSVRITTPTMPEAGWAQYWLNR